MKEHEHKFYEDGGQCSICGKTVCDMLDDSRKETAREILGLNMNTVTIPNYTEAAKEVLNTIDDLGFTIEYPPDYNKLVERIANIIKNNIEGNVNRTESKPIFPENILI
jgi:hypothetical protein